MKNSLFILLLFASTSVLAQGQLSGKIVDSQTKAALPFASIALKNVSQPNSLLGVKTDMDGVFKLNNIPYGVYTATISFVGYEPNTIEGLRFSQYNQKTKLKDILLVQKSKELKTVVVAFEKKNIEIQADKKVFNVEKNISAQGGNLSDVLRNVPSVSVGADGSVSLRGKSNVTILIDGKQSPLFSDMETALQSISAESIESIEVITNPTAKYEAQGLGGIINIVMKSGKRKKGWSGSVNLGAQYNWKTNAGANINYRPSDKVGLFFNANGGISNEWEYNAYNRTNYNSDASYESVSTKYRVPRRLNVDFGIEYNLTKRDKVTWTNSIFRGSFDGDDTTDIYVRDNPQTLREYWFRNNVYNAKPSNTSTNLKYNRSYTDKRQSLNVEANFSKRTYIRQSDYITNVFDAQDNKIRGFVQRNPIDGGNYNGAFQIDYSHPVGKEGKIEIGERTYFMDFQSENFPTIQFDNQAEQFEAILKNDFHFLQQVHGVYTTYSTTVKDYSFQIGLRGEYFKYDGTAAQLNNANFVTDYLSLFPSAFVSKKLSESSDVNLSYSRRVNRPDFFQLLPFIRVNSPLDTSIGNPGLNPEFINAFELSYSNRYGKDNTFFISGYYQLTDNIIQRFSRFNEDGSTFSQTQNLASGSTFGIEITNQIYLMKNWDVTLNANGFRNIINGNVSSNGQSFDGYGGFVKLVSNTNLPKNWQLQVSGNYFAPKVIIQGKILGYGFMDLALKKSFFDKQLNLTLLASDIFNTQKTTTEYNIYPDQIQSVYKNEQTQFFGFNLQYTFPRNGKKTFDKGKKSTSQKTRDDNLKDGNDGGY